MTPEQNMATRIAEIIEYKTGGKQAEFARLMGWSKQYTNNLINGKTVGLTPITAIVEKIPEINARWLLTGEGNMVNTTSNVLRTWIMLEPYIPAMTPEDRANIDAGGTYTAEDIARWSTILADRRNALEARFAEAYAKQQN